MSSYPSGTVTFLFTDVEGSTTLAQKHPDIWERLRERHHAILQSAMEVHKGYVFQIIGDAFCVAFHNAGDGLSAAVDAQRRLHYEDWGESIIKVRMGLHTGSAELYGNDYRGYLTMAKVQRIMSVAYGSQVLLSSASAELLHNELPAGIMLRDMNEHRLKGLPDPERLWQMLASDLQQDFPPLSSLSEIPNNLPLQLTTFIGREKEINQIKKRLEKNRLVTLTGSGGVGKTRLSIQVASELLSEFPHGVWLVELAPITDPALVTLTICSALDVTPQGGMPALNVLTEYLKPKKLLLVVDNCEHLVDACAQLCDTLLHACPDLRMIASSREALGIDGENAYRVPSLSLPHPNDGLHGIQESEAVTLFLERANAVQPDFQLTETNAQVVAQTCQRLDGIALAIELAASRVKLLKVEQIAARLDDAFRLLTGGNRTALPRQQTLRAMIDWSYNLLSEEEKTVLRYLSVFVGGWTLEAAESVCNNPNVLDLLTHLVDKSLVAVDREHGDEVRYYLLETIRQYAREKLAESGEGEQTRARHLDYFLELTQKAESEIYGTGQIEWLQKLEDEHENMVVAMEWSLQGNVTAGQQLMGALWWGWNLNGHKSEGHKWLKKMLAATPENETLVRAKLLSGLGWMDEKIENRHAANEKSIAIFRKLGDESGAAFPLGTLGIIAYLQSNYERAIQLFEESLDLFTAAGNQWGVRHMMGTLGYTAAAQGNFTQAQKFYEESLSICKEIGDKEGIGWTLYLMGNLAVSIGNYAQGMELFEEALQIEKAVKSKPMITWLQNAIGAECIRNGDFERARLAFLEELESCQKMGSQGGIGDSLEGLGLVAYHQGDFLKAGLFYSESLELFHRIENKLGIADCLVCIGNLTAAHGSYEKFVRLSGMAETLIPDIKNRVWTFVRDDTEQFIESARSALGTDAYTAAWEAGKQMSLDESIAYALKELGQ